MQEVPSLAKPQLFRTTGIHVIIETIFGKRYIVHLECHDDIKTDNLPSLYHQDQTVFRYLSTMQVLMIVNWAFIHCFIITFDGDGRNANGKRVSYTMYFIASVLK